MTAPAHTARAGLSRPMLAGFVTAVVGFASSFTIVLAGLQAVGATDRQAASGLLVLALGMGVLSIGLSVRHRMPLSIAWSTPGAALLVSAGAVSGGYPAALGAFLMGGLLIVLAGFWRPMAAWIAAIPAALANALLAGVLLPLCIAPAKSMVELPWMTAPVVVTWLALILLVRRWAVPGALLAAGVAVAIGEPVGDAWSAHALPTLAWTTPTLDLATLAGLGLPLFIVTMASQNVTGMSVLAAFGYHPPLRPVLVSTGVATAVTAPFGAHGINLAAITAALSASPDADPDPGRRWIAASTNGVVIIVLGLGAGLATGLLSAAPPLLVQAVAGLALLPAFGAALAAATEDAGRREAATITFLVSASGIAALGVSAPFWGLLAGLAVLALQRVAARRAPAG